MLRNKTQMVILKLDGKMNSEDPFHIKLIDDGGKSMVVSLSLFMNQYGDALRAANIKVDDQLSIEGELLDEDSSSPFILYPISITKKGWNSRGC